MMKEMAGGAGGTGGLGGPGAAGPLDDDAKIKEASKLFEDCINSIQKETADYQAQ
jgi:hypothetical protein